MIKNYFKIGIRSLMRNKSFTAINIFGLTLGITTCLLIMLYVQNELSYDSFNKKADQIVRVVFRGSIQGEKMKEAMVMPPVAQTFKSEYPEVLEATRLRRYGYPRVTYGDKTFKENAFAYADSNFFEVFTLPFLKGNPKTALLEPNTIVISESVAKKYFGDEDPIGKILQFKDLNSSFKITGVMRLMPVNSHFHFDLFASMASFPQSREFSWMTSEYYTYLVLPKGYDYKKLEAKLPADVEKYMGSQLQKAMGMTYAQFRQKGNELGLYLQPLMDIHLHSDLNLELAPVSDIRYVYIFSVVAIFMLLIACINFMNLSTAGASKRAREVGIRKVLGSLNGQLVRQFLLESLLLTCFAFLLSIILVFWTLPFLNKLSGKNLSFNLLSNPWLLPGLLLFALVTGLLAGSYPAFFLSSFKPVTVLKGKLASMGKTVSLRSGLVVFQFFISIVLIIGTIIVHKQLAFIQNEKLGYNKDQVLIVQESYWLGKNQEAFKQKLLQDPRVVSISSSGYLPAGNTYNNNFMIYADNNSDQLVKTLRYDVDFNYIQTLGMEMADGRNFSKSFGTDSLGIIINEETAKAFGWDKNALGHNLTRPDNDGTKLTYHVIGVVKNFHFRSFHEPISPLVMVLNNNNENIIVKTNTKDIAGLLNTMKKNWNDLKGEVPFSYTFLDDRFNNSYESEQKIGLILSIFAGVTIFVACLGLFGLATFTAEQRTKEIGIRKVLGATVTSIVSLLSKDFLKLVIIAFIIATPVAWYMMNKWLQDFAYKTNISGWIFLLAAALAVTITILTVSFRAIRAAVVNPVDSLRSE
ncbi:MAG TPA: ABC transporter permease [Puia sp.]|jgi:putative ABC transport system permease protein|nr:ABC transporter permease [Puia sp.]